MEKTNESVVAGMPHLEELSLPELFMLRSSIVTELSLSGRFANRQVAGFAKLDAVKEPIRLVRQGKDVERVVW